MAKDFFELIARAASRANDKIDSVDRGEYRPTIEIVTQGKPSQSTTVRTSGPRRQPARAVA